MDSCLDSKNKAQSISCNLKLLCRDGGIHKDHLVAKDSSGNGNDLPLVVPPLRQRVTISQVGIFPTPALPSFDLLPMIDYPGVAPKQYFPLPSPWARGVYTYV